LPGYARNEMEINFTETRADEIRLVLRNDDNPPIEIADVHAFGPIYRLLWLAQPGATYRLTYGNDRIAPPSYDVFAIRSALERGLEPDLWTLGEPVANPLADPASSFGEFLSRPAIFSGALVLAAAALLLLLAKALKKSADTDEPTP
jgi:hypothetical protein